MTDLRLYRHSPSTRERPRFRGDNDYRERKRPAPSEFVERNAGACSLRGTPKPAPPSRRSRSYLRDAEAYMLISMPTCTSAIFGVFQVIGGSPWSAARLPRSCMHHVASYCRSQVNSDLAWLGVDVRGVSIVSAPGGNDRCYRCAAIPVPSQPIVHAGFLTSGRGSSTNIFRFGILTARRILESSVASAESSPFRLRI